jgi:AcrR family transcriptional regulator
MGATPRPPTNKGAEFVAQGIDRVAIGAGDSRRQELLRAALDVIAERGFSDTRIADVADRAGTSPALVIYYFRTKDNLLTEAVRLAEDLWYDFGYERMATVTGAVARLDEMITTTFLAPADIGFPDLGALWVDLWARSLRHPKVARVREEFDARWRRILAGIVLEGQASGEFAGVDPASFATALSALLDGLTVQVTLGDPGVDPESARSIAMGFASAMLQFAWAPEESGSVPVGVPAG